MSADLREVVGVTACWKHQAAMASMASDQAADYAAACPECEVQYAEAPDPIPGQMDLLGGPPVEDVPAPVLEDDDEDDDDLDLLTDYAGIDDGVTEDEAYAEYVSDMSAPAEEVAPPCPDCGQVVLNAATHPNFCTGKPQPAPAAQTAPESAPQPSPEAPAPKQGQNDYMPEEALFAADDFRTSPVINLRERFTEPPFTVLNRKGGDWIKRDQQWKTLGIQSELGRDEGLLGYENLNSPDFNNGQFNTLQSTSIFSPTLAEVACRWYSATDSEVLDPFAGGSVRGLVAGLMGRHYTGIDLSSEQVEANRAQVSIMDENRERGLTGTYDPQWISGDSAELETLLPPGKKYDLIFSCPPYAYLENYSDDPRDISSLSYPAFLEAYRTIIRRAVGRLHNDRFIAWVIGEVREKGGHACLGLVPDTIKAFQEAGCGLYNDHVVLLPIASAAIRTPKQFNASRKAGRVHEYMLVFVKGDGKRAARWAAAQDGPL